LQTLAGTDVGFGRTRESNEDGVYKVVVEFENEELGRAALESGLRICHAAVRDTPIDIEEEIRLLRELAARALPSATRTALKQAARARRIPFVPVTKDVYRLGLGHKQRRLLVTQTDHASAAADAVARDREATIELLRAAGLPVPQTDLTYSPAEAWEEAEPWLPVVVRPRQGVGRSNTFFNLRTRPEIESAYLLAAAKGDGVMVEKQVPGAAWRLLVVGEWVAAAALVGPALDGTPAGADVTERVHPEVAARAVEAARLLGLDVAGVDVVAEDIRRPLEEQKGAITGVHPRPGLRVHIQPTAGTAQPVAETVVARCFPEGDNGRIPVVAVTGVNGKTTVTRLIAHVNGRNHKCVGMSCTEGIYVEGKRLEAGDCSGPSSARAVLANPKVDVAVLETARGGILRTGLGFDRCDVAVVTNIGEGDHLGLADIETPEQLARVKCVIVEAVARDGSAVLNAADPLVAEMAEHCRGDVVFFATDPNNPTLAAHRARQGRVAYVGDGHIVLAEGDQEIPLVALSSVPLTHAGRIGFQVENCLAAAAACWSMGVPCQVIRVGLETFHNDLSRSPGRFNVFDIKGATVVLDYGHNASALACLIQAMTQLPCRNRRMAVYSTAGDRRDCDLIRQGELLGQHFDRVILYEDHYLRGRQPGEIIGLFRQGVESTRRSPEVEEIRGAVKAMQHALSVVQPGDLLLLQADVVDESVEFIRGYLAAHLEAEAIPVLTPMAVLS
jgi:cyanophycin synthetase